MGNKNYTLEDFEKKFGGKLEGNKQTKILRISSLRSAKNGDITFFLSSKYKKDLDALSASAVITTPEYEHLFTIPKIISNNPYLYMAKVSNLLNPKKKYKGFISQHSNISCKTKIGQETFIDAYVSIKSNVQIGKNCAIHHSSYIGENVKIGDNVTINPNVTIYSGSKIMSNVIIHSGAVIGSDGFGMAKDDKKWIKIPQLGNVVIYPDCEIGANTTIDRGSFDDTIINEGVKLDNQIQIGHNCIIGKHTVIAGCVGIAGSVLIGRYCKIGGGVKISGHLEIADNVTISGGTVMTKPLIKSGVYTAVLPVSSHEKWLKNASLFRNLRKMYYKILELEKKIKQMKRCL